MEYVDLTDVTGGIYRSSCCQVCREQQFIIWDHTQVPHCTVLLIVTGLRWMVLPLKEYRLNLIQVELYYVITITSVWA